MNEIFQDLITEGVVLIYLNNILIFTSGNPWMNINA
jgi:hypothetical protein